MGCDIHMHQEVKIKGEWYHLNQPYVDRNYSLFGVMAGVCGCGPAIVEPRGVPDNITILTRVDLDAYGTDAHTLSWFGLEEIKALEDWWVKTSSRFDFYTTFGYLFHNGWNWNETTNRRGVEDVRWIFWFDN